MSYRHVFDWRTGYFVASLPEEEVRRHPLGEQSFEQFVALKSDKRPIPAQFGTAVVVHEAGTSGEWSETVRTRVRYLDPEILFARFDRIAQEENFCDLDLLDDTDFDILWASGDDEDYLEQVALADTFQAAILTVGTGKTYATYAAALAAAASGDSVEMYASPGGWTILETQATSNANLRLGVDLTALGQTLTGVAGKTYFGVAIYLQLVGAPGGNITLTIRTGATMGAGTVLGTVVYPTASIPSAAYAFIMLGVPAGYTPGAVAYHWELEGTDGYTPDASNYVRVGDHSAGTYTGGSEWRKVAGVWSESALRDVTFRCHELHARCYNEQMTDSAKILTVINKTGSDCVFAYDGSTFAPTGIGSRIVGMTAYKLGAVANNGFYIIANYQSVERCIATGYAQGFYSDVANSGEWANCLAYANTYGFRWGHASCTIMAYHCTAAKNTTTGFYGTGTIYVRTTATLSAGNTTSDYANQLTTTCLYSVSADATAGGVAAVTGFLTTDFVDYAGNDFRLKAAVKATTKANIAAYAMVREDGLARVRRRTAGALYAGYHDPDPGYIPVPAEVADSVTAYGLDSELAGTLPAATPQATFDCRLSASVVAAAGGIAVTGGITLSQDSAGVTVTLRRYKKSDDSLVATVVNATASFTGGVQKTWAQIAGAAVTFAPDTAREEYLLAAVSGGTPAITAEASGRFPYAVIPAFASPGLAVLDDGDGSVTVTASGNSGQTSRLYYRMAGAAAWTLHGTTVTGDGVITDLAGLLYDRVYHFLLVPWDSTTGTAGPPSNLVLVLMADASAAGSTSGFEDQFAEGLDEMFEEMGVPATHAPFGGVPAVVDRVLVDIQDAPFLESADAQTLTYRAGLKARAVDLASWDRRDTWTVNGVLWPVRDAPRVRAGRVLFELERTVRVGQGAGAVRGGRGGG